MTISRREFTRAALSAASLAALGGPALAGAEHMIQKAIPSTGEMVPIVGLGTNRYGVGSSATERAPLIEALGRFHQLGGKLVDTAPQYRTSESVLGDLIADLGIREDLFVATKADKDPGGDATISQMRESSRRLQSGGIDLMQVHNLRGWQTALPAMREWKQDGRVRYVGITTSRDSQYAEFEKIMNTEKLDLIQINYSLAQRDAARRILPLAADKGIAVIINRAFGAGRLFKSVGGEPLPEWAAEFCDSWAQFLLKYAVGHPAATLSIPGMTKIHHVEDNMGAAHGRLPTASERAKQEVFFDSL